MDKEILEQLQLIQQGMVQMEQRLSQEIKDTEARMVSRIEESEARTEERIKELDTRITELDARTEERIRESEARMEEKIHASEVRTKILIENKVTDRIDALVDGYKATHEKQWELEHRTEHLQSLVEDLQVRVAVLESKTA